MQFHASQCQNASIMQGNPFARAHSSNWKFAEQSCDLVESQRSLVEQSQHALVEGPEEALEGSAEVQGRN